MVVCPVELIRSSSNRTVVTLVLLLSLCLLDPRSGSLVSADNDLTAVSILASVDASAQLAVSDMTSAYLLVSSNITVSVAISDQADALVSARPLESVDFATVNIGLTDLQASSSPSLQMYPIACSAVVPIYRLDALGANAPQLVFDRSVLAEIFLGEITWWNDSRIQDDNHIVMPQQRITLILPPAGNAINQIVTIALGKFLDLFNQTVPVSLAPAWPTTRYYRSSILPGATGAGAGVIAMDGSLAFALLDVALSLENMVAAMINRAGSTVQADQTSVTFAAVELGTKPRARTTADMDLTDATGTSAWPICMMSYLLLDTESSRTTCHVRAAVVQFWLWYYSSSAAASLLASRQYAPVPSIVLTQLDIVNQLSNNVFCRGQVALPASSTSTRIIGAPVSVSFVSTLFSALYQDPDTSTDWVVQTSSDQVTIQQIVNAEIDIAFVNPENVETSLIQSVMASPDFLMLPTYLTAIVMSYNPQITPSLNIANYNLTLDMTAVGLIWFSCILNWNDPMILAQNPWLASHLPSEEIEPIPIMQISGCGTAVQTPLSTAFVQRIIAYQAESGDALLKTCIANNSQMVLEAGSACVDVPAINLLFAPNEATIPSLVLGTIGSMGVQQADGNPSFGLVTIRELRGQLWVNTSASMEGEASCLPDTTDQSLIVDGLSSGLTVTTDNAGCYRGTQQIIAIIRTNYLSTATDASSCDRGYDALSFLQWFYSTGEIDVLVNSVDSVRVSYLPSSATYLDYVSSLNGRDSVHISSVSPSIYTNYLAALDAVECDGQTLLVTLPVEWQLSTGVINFAYALSSLGLIGAFCLELFVVHYRQHPMIRSASPLFLQISIAGVAMLFLSGYFLVSSATTALCSAFSWSVNIGLILTFAPLFAKTWRIYRIFGRKKLSVVSISNRKLVLLVLVILTLELVLLSLWQGIGNLQPIEKDVTSSSKVNSAVSAISDRLVVNEYVQCGVPSGASTSMFVVICVEKGLLFVFGALMAFTTRKVSSTFNESSGIAFAIYNVCFTIGIIAPIILVISAVGDVMILLLVFALLWIAFFTGGILFVPKVMKIVFHSSDNEQGLNTSVQASSSSSSGYVFLSLAALSTVSVLQGYLTALQRHVTQVQQKIAKLKEQKGGEQTITSPNLPRTSLVKASRDLMAARTVGGRDVSTTSSISLDGKSLAGVGIKVAQLRPSDSDSITDDQARDSGQPRLQMAAHRRAPSLGQR